MIVKIPTTKKVNIRYVDVTLPIYFGEEDIPNDFPCRQGDTWQARIDIDTGMIQNWEQGRAEEFYLKVCNGGTYILIDDQGNQIAAIRKDYAPNDFIPGEYGDYVHFVINENGEIMNWYEEPDFYDFFKDDND